MPGMRRFGLREASRARPRLQFRFFMPPGVRPVDFRFTEEQLMIQDVARRIAREKIAPSAEHFDRSGAAFAGASRRAGTITG